MKTTCLLAITAGLTNAWSGNGHLIVAKIAENLLTEKASGSLDAANQMLTYLAEFLPEDTTHEDKHAFVECATFADDLKYHGEMWQSDFHFLTTPNIEEGQASDYDIVTKKNDIVKGLTDLVAWISGKGDVDYNSGYIVPFLMNKFDDNVQVAQSYGLRLIIHYYGDIVQPFHCQARYNKEYPSGDKGANAFPLKYHYEVDELHALWDKVLYEQHTNLARPFTDASWDTFVPMVDAIQSGHQSVVESTTVYENIDFTTWSDESFEIAKGLYVGVTENDVVPQAYIDKWAPVANDRLTLGGYRLYYAIDYIFGDSNDEAEFLAAMAETVFGDIPAGEEVFLQ